MSWVRVCTLLLLAASITAVSAKETKYSLLYQAPETAGEWVFMFAQEELSGRKLKPSDMPAIEADAHRTAKLYCGRNARWYDKTVIAGGMFDGESALAPYVKVPLAKKQPDRIKITYFTGSEATVECETPKSKPCPPGKVCLW